MRTFIATTLTLGLWLTLSGCVSTTLTERWKDTAYNGPPLHKVLVVGVQNDQGQRRLWEDAMVAALGRCGIQSQASYPVFPDQAPAPEQLTSVAAREGFDGVIATRLLGAAQRAYIDPYWGYGWGWRPWGYWGPYPGPVYVNTEYQADYQTDVFTVDASGGKLIWSGITRSLDPSSTQALIDEISRVLAPNLVKEGILKGNKH